MNLEGLTPDQVKALFADGRKELWYRGDLRHVCRPHGQTQAYDFVHSWKAENPTLAGPLVLNCRREFGKTFFMLLLLVERCIRVPDQETRFGAPLEKQGLEIVRPILKTLLDPCPPELIHDWITTRIEFKNPRWGKPNATSTLTLVGCKDDAQSLRGPRSDMITIDECREIPRFGYVVKSVIGPHFLGRKNPLMVFASTPPDTAGHDFMDFIEQARVRGRYFLMPGSRDLDMTPADRLMLIDLLGVNPDKLEESPDWQREIECSLIPDRNKLIIPEFIDAEDTVVVDSYERPSHYFPHVCVDFGFKDFDAVLYAYNDFESQLLVIEDEIFANYQTTGTLAKLMKEKEAQVFKDPPWPVTRFGDNDLKELANLRMDYNVPIRPVDKWDKESARSALRTRVGARRIRIHTRCKELIHQLKTAIRKENGDFERDEKYGHADLIAALIYLNRMVNCEANPFPETHDWRPNVFRGRPAKPAQGSVEITRQPMVITRRRIA